MEKTDQLGLSPLHYSCQAGKTELTKSLIEKGEDVEAKTREGWTPLIFAASEGNIKDALLLIAKNPNVVHGFDVRGKTALHYACIHNQAAFAKMLLDNGANISATDDFGDAAIHCASLFKSYRAFELLLDYKADIKAKSSNGTTPLHLACAKNDTHLVGRLLDNGADIEALYSSNMPFRHGITIAQHMDRYALETNSSSFVNIEVSKPFMENIKRLHTNNITHDDDVQVNGSTPLLFAAYTGAAETIELLINRGANTEAKNSLGYTALHIACAFGKTRAIKQLITRREILNERDKNDLTPLHFAVLFGHEEAVKILIENGADIEARTVDGYTPLTLSVLDGHSEIVNILIENNANVTSVDNEGYLPLHFACTRGDLEIYNIVMKGIEKLEQN